MKFYAKTNRRIIYKIINSLKNIILKLKCQKKIFREKIIFIAQIFLPNEDKRRRRTPQNLVLFFLSIFNGYHSIFFKIILLS